MRSLKAPSRFCLDETLAVGKKQRPFLQRFVQPWREGISAFSRDRADLWPLCRFVAERESLVKSLRAHAIVTLGHSRWTASARQQVDERIRYGAKKPIGLRPHFDYSDPHPVSVPKSRHVPAHSLMRELGISRGKSRRMEEWRLAADLR